ncbi:MAG TPA: hypothetical protein VHB25_08565 [Gemmatimonadaceae bacterium]|nr:hypothetical protein [Gemmatimonadaceae bacterium]
MSVIDVRDLTSALLQDDALGLAATMERLGGASVALNFVAWKRAAMLQPTTAANVYVTPEGWQPEVRRQADVREAVMQLRIGYESFQADAELLEQELAIAATALAQVLDGLRAYSDAHGGTVVDVIDPLQYAFGQFPGGTSAGFTVILSIEEQAQS